MEIYIYGLIDPITKKVRYVGKTKRKLRTRLRAHINDKPKNNTYKFNWIQSLIQKGVEPEIFLIETCGENMWVDREKYWIGYFNDLTNLTLGGDSDTFFCEETLNKIGEKVKKVWECDEYRKKISEQRIMYWSNPDNRKKHSNKLKNKKLSVEHKEKISIGRKDGKPIMVNGVEYRNIKYAVKNIPINRQTLKRRLLSKKFPEYFYL